MKQISLKARALGNVNALNRLAEKEMPPVVEQVSFGADDVVTKEQNHAAHMNVHRLQQQTAFQRYMRSFAPSDMEALKQIEKHIEAHRAYIK